MNSQEVTSSESLNNSIREMAHKARLSILAKDDSTWTEISQNMILAAQYCYIDFMNEIKNHIYDTCHDLHDDRLSRDRIANSFYNKVIKSCRLFLN